MEILHCLPSICLLKWWGLRLFSDVWSENAALSKDSWKFIQIHQYYTMAIALLISCFSTSVWWQQRARGATGNQHQQPVGDDLWPGLGPRRCQHRLQPAGIRGRHLNLSQPGAGSIPPWGGARPPDGVECASTDLFLFECGSLLLMSDSSGIGCDHTRDVGVVCAERSKSQT